MSFPADVKDRSDGLLHRAYLAECNGNDVEARRLRALSDKILRDYARLDTETRKAAAE